MSTPTPPEAATPAVGPPPAAVGPRPVTLVGPRPLDALDAAAERTLDRLRGDPLLDRAMYTASMLGDWSLIWHLIGAARGVTSERRADEAIRLSIALGIESAIVNQGVKRLFRRRRPAHDVKHPHRLRTPRTSSFPSGHASAAFCAATILSEQHRPVAPLWYGLATLVSLSRPYVRVHHFSDVVAGALLGEAIGQVLRHLLPEPARS